MRLVTTFKQQTNIQRADGSKYWNNLKTAQSTRTSTNASLFSTPSFQEVLTKMLMLKLPICYSTRVQVVLTRKEIKKKKKKVDKVLDKLGQMIYNIIINNERKINKFWEKENDKSKNKH